MPVNSGAVWLTFARLAKLSAAGLGNEAGDGEGAGYNRRGEYADGSGGFESGEHVRVLSGRDTDGIPVVSMAVFERPFVSGLCRERGPGAMFCVRGEGRYIGIQSVARTGL